jgi:hypothetical protein
MIIHPVTSHIERGELHLTARIELERPPYDLPETLWFRFPESQAHLVSDCADGFAVTLLAPALARGEDIHVRGTLSPRLASGLNEYQRVQNLRKPQRYRPIQIHADGYERRASEGSKAATSFSGGIDSFFTVWTHTRQNEKFPGNELSYALLIRGFDFALEDHHTFSACRDAYRPLLASLGIELLIASTNARAFDLTNNWTSASTFALIGLGHLLSRGLALYYVPANDAYEDYPKGAVATLQDTLLCSESLQVLGDGALVPKFEKIVALARVPLTYDHLRVCFVKPNGLANCGECGKCLNTMVALELCGALDKYTTFALPLDSTRLRFSTLSYPARFLFVNYLQGALTRRRYDLAFDILIKLLWNHVRWGRTWISLKLGFGAQHSH